MSQASSTSTPGGTSGTIHQDDEDAFRILIATDNHIGYLERDPIRGQDSFQTFEEILQIAEIEQVDFVLLGGDLFHHNRPTRSCLYQTMKMLRRHCLGERTSKIWISSDQSINFADEFCKANYLDDNFNVKMPVFSIHGNHDDPSGVGNLCALNLLQVSGLVNYFGASQSIQDVEIHPIVMRKGNSSLALYGLGNIRDERLHRQWRSGHVNFLRGSEDCFNLFVFHQNRARHGPTSHIPEEFIDGFIDLVFWGHEHECRIVPESYEKFDITQPGSSVATSLSEGEAEPKHVGLLTIKGSEFSLDKIRLKTTRPLQFATVILSRVQGLNRSDTKAIQTYLEGIVESLIEKARYAWEEQQQQSPYHLPLEDPDMEMPMPLVRIRVDYSGGYETFNPQQFGQKFIDRVANPKDILKFQRTQTRANVTAKPSEMISDLNLAIPERLDTLRVEDLVSELLSRDLLILPETGLEEAVMSLVEKSDKEAIRTFVTKSVAQTRATITVIPEDLSLDYVKRKSAESKESQDQPRRQYGNAVLPTQEMRGSTTHVNNDSDDDLMASPLRSQQSQSSPSQRTLDTAIMGSTRGRGRGRGGRGGASSQSARGRARGSSATVSTATHKQRKRRIQQDSDEEEDLVESDEQDDASTSTAAPRATRARHARGASSQATYAISSDDENDGSHYTNKRPAPASSPSPTPPPPSASASQNKRRRVLPGSK
ncbi:double-strand break repair protein MRE11A-like [Mucor ambiguus]|uniref:Double-strand break repair protein n=1 Tax=Mucor ambiguus TaxID=91626 RepID=A0A0C9M3U3_9FUNG|nr:double-strand break repair protein MRE11A-like [Mucor ambiguus]